MHAAVARSTFPSQNVKKKQHARTTFGKVHAVDPAPPWSRSPFTAWVLCSDLVDPKVGVQVLNDVHTTRCQGVPQGEQAEEHLASCTGTVVDDDVPGPLGNQGILVGQLFGSKAMAMSQKKPRV